ncbi:hypothetical protein P5F71_07945 [Clostridium perfringens]|nr:hypothetical protein [Clostridium perfringens]
MNKIIKTKQNVLKNISLNIRFFKKIEDIRHNFIRKGTILIVTDSQEQAKQEYEKLIKLLFSGIRYNKFIKMPNYTLRFNGYTIKFISVDYQNFNLRGLRPEIVYWLVKKTTGDEVFRISSILRDLVAYSSRLEPFRRGTIKNTGCILDLDILTNDFKIKEYINTKSFSYKNIRNIYIKNKISKIRK